MSRGVAYFCVLGIIRGAATAAPLHSLSMALLVTWKDAGGLIVLISPVVLLSQMATVTNSYSA